MPRPKKKVKPQFFWSDFSFSMIIGLILGDGGLYTFSGKTARFVFSQTAKDQNKKLYVEHVFSNISHLLLYQTPKMRKVSVKNPDKTTTYHYQYRIDTLTFKEFMNIFHIFYIQDQLTKKFVKIVPKNMHQLMNSMVFTYWFLDDGYINPVTQNLQINTQGFTFEEVLYLSRILWGKMGIYAWPTRENQQKHHTKVHYRIHISNQSYDQVIEIMKPHYLEFMSFKFLITQSSLKTQAIKRTIRDATAGRYNRFIQFDDNLKMYLVEEKIWDENLQNVIETRSVYIKNNDSDEYTSEYWKKYKNQF